MSPGSGRVLQPETIYPVHQVPITTGYGCRLDSCIVEYKVYPTPTHDQHWELNHRHSDLESNILSIRPLAPICPFF